MSFKKFIETARNEFSKDKKGQVAEKSNMVDEIEVSKWLEDGASWIPNWRKILERDWDAWQERIEQSKGNEKVLIATTVGGNSVLTPLETLFGVALTARGAEVHFLLCDKALPACQNSYGTDLKAQESFIESGPSLCEWCYGSGKACMDSLGLTVHSLSDLLDSSDQDWAQELSGSIDLQEIDDYECLQIPVGESVSSATLRFFGRGDLIGEQYAEQATRQFFKSALLTVKGGGYFV